MKVEDVKTIIDKAKLKKYRGKMKTLCPECKKWEQWTIMNKAIEVIRSCETDYQLQSAERFMKLAQKHLTQEMNLHIRLEYGYKHYTL